MQPITRHAIAKYFRSFKILKVVAVVLAANNASPIFRSRGGVGL